jgi:hypothetical protein
MRKGHYYSIRTGRHSAGLRFDLSMLQRLLRDLYISFSERGYFQQAFGYHCVDAGDVPGDLGSDLEAQVFRALRKPTLWPLVEKVTDYSEDDCFDVIEFLYDCTSRPVETPGAYHGFNNCGWHYTKFDKDTGQQEFREEVNSVLRDYTAGWELSETGEILALADEGFQPLLVADLPYYDPSNVEQRVAAAVRKFRSRGSTIEDRRDAVRDLADVLEFLRPTAKERFLTAKDDGALFEIANEFAIRHHNGRQKGDYNVVIWYRWIFYVYLATIHAVMRAIKDPGGQRVQ